MRISSIVTMGIVALLLSWPGTSGASVVFTQGAEAADPMTVNNAAMLLGTSNLCAHSDVGGVTGDNLAGRLNPCTISFTNAAGTINIKQPGAGVAMDPKYGPNPTPPPAMIGLSDRVSSIVTDGKNSRAFGVATFSAATPAGGRFPVTLNARGEVSKINPALVGALTPGTGAAQATDPLQLTFTSSGSLTYGFLLGDKSIDPSTGLPVPNLGFFSDEPTGRNIFNASAGLSGVTFNGQSFSGQLFNLVIDSSGVVSSSGNLNVEFTPSPLLGLSASTVQAEDAFIKSNLHLQSDGSVGLDPGVLLPLFGLGAPIDTLTFGFSPGTVTLEDAVGAVASVPEPSTLFLQTATILLALVVSWGRRTITTRPRERDRQF